jgi:hypothetical protein
MVLKAGIAPLSIVCCASADNMPFQPAPILPLRVAFMIDGSVGLSFSAMLRAML